MNAKIELSAMEPTSFENMVNAIAIRVLGAGATGFGPGADAGRDGYFEGEAEYPSAVERWHGVWYIQSKFHAPNLSSNAQAWLVKQVQNEIKAFERAGSKRKWPDNWIIATNVDPSGAVDGGSFDTINSMVAASSGKQVNVAVWGGQKLIEFLRQYPQIARAYGHYLTPGHVISKLYDEITNLGGDKATLDEIVRFFLVAGFGENVYTKLDRAGSAFTTRPAVHDLFIDLPYTEENDQPRFGLLAALTKSSA